MIDMIWQGYLERVFADFGLAHSDLDSSLPMVLVTDEVEEADRRDLHQAGKDSVRRIQSAVSSPGW